MGLLKAVYDWTGFYVGGHVGYGGGSLDIDANPLPATGLGAYFAKATGAGDFPRAVLGIAIMCILVTRFNRLLWRPLYASGERRPRLG